MTVRKLQQLGYEALLNHPDNSFATKLSVIKELRRRVPGTCLATAKATTEHAIEKRIKIKNLQRQPELEL